MTGMPFWMNSQRNLNFESSNKVIYCQKKQVNNVSGSYFCGNLVYVVSEQK